MTISDCKVNNISAQALSKRKDLVTDHFVLHKMIIWILHVAGQIETFNQFSLSSGLTCHHPPPGHPQRAPACRAPPWSAPSWWASARPRSGSRSTGIPSPWKSKEQNLILSQVIIKWDKPFWWPWRPWWPRNSLRGHFGPSIWTQWPMLPCFSGL